MLKLQTLSVIFVLIIVPITILLSYYIDTQIDTIALQNSYDTKLLNATYDAIVSFELNTVNNEYSTNADSLRRDITASINTFTKSLANNFGISGSGKNYILPYVPALVYTLYDGYYIYSPIEKTNINDKGETVKTYEHTLKPYVYYTARYVNTTSNTDFIINYSLDNYIVVYGYIDGDYYSEAGYLINKDKFNGYTFTDDAYNYFESAKSFTDRFYDEVKNKTLTVIANGKNENIDSDLIFKIDNNNDPDNKLSPFVEHKSTIIKESIQSNLNSAIANYNAKELTGTSYEFRMPILDDTEWDKMLSNVSIITFMQGLPVGINTYNNYMIVTSTENKQCIDEQSLYFIAKENDGKEGKYYHRINCPLLIDELNAGKKIEGYRSIDFDGIYKETKDETTGEIKGKYEYKHSSLACYECIVQSRISGFKYNDKHLIQFDNVTDELRKIYYTALFKERNNLIKVSSFVNGDTSAKL